MKIDSDKPRGNRLHYMMSLFGKGKMETRDGVFKQYNRHFKRNEIPTGRNLELLLNANHKALPTTRI